MGEVSRIRMSLRKRTEEYLEAMYILQKEKGFIRVKDIAKKLGVKPSSVVGYLDDLAKKGYVEYEKHEFIRLTEEGKKIASGVYEKHLLLKDFLSKVLGVPEKIAEEDACYIEHGINDLTIQRLTQFAKFLEENCEDIVVKFKKTFSSR